MTVSEKFQLVLDVAQKAQVMDSFALLTKSIFKNGRKLMVYGVFSPQNIFGKMSDVLEKIKK